MDRTQPQTPPSSESPPHLSRAAFREMLFSMRNVLSNIVWPLQVGVLTVLIGLIISTLINIISLPNISQMENGLINKNSDVYIEKNNLLSLLILSTRFLVIIIGGMFINILRSTWHWAQERHYVTTDKVLETLSVTIDVIAISFPITIIYLGIIGLHEITISLLAELNLHLTSTPVDPVTRALSNLASIIIQHPWYSALGGMLAIGVTYGAFIVRVQRTRKQAGEASFT